MPNECWALELAQGTLPKSFFWLMYRMDSIHVTFWIVVYIVSHNRPRDTV
jgi:ERG2 and Sigma1 receptor like protein